MEGADILSRLDTEGASVTETANGEGYWLAVSRTHNGHSYSHSVRLAKPPSYEDIENARETFKIWWAETIKEQIP
jgi:hypothetical protein